MDLAHHRAAEGGVAGEAIVAGRQGRGRGQKGRVWSAEVGGLWMSVIGRPDAAQGLEAVSLRVGIAVANALEAAIPDLPLIGLKWPNDLMMADRKFGGVLIEARWQAGRCLWVVTGVGINIHNRIPPELADRAIALATVVDAPPAAELAVPIANAVAAALRGGPLDSGEQQQWNRRDTLRGRLIDAPVVGRADGVTERGALRVCTGPGKVVECAVGVVASDS